MDCVINNMDVAPQCRSEQESLGGLPSYRWAKVPRDAIGTSLYLTANGVRQRADVFSGGSYASTSDMRPHFGLGSASAVDGLEVH